MIIKRIGLVLSLWAPLVLAAQHFPEGAVSSADPMASEAGADGFYRGYTAEVIVRTMQAKGGIIRHEDLLVYREVWRDPVRIEWKGHVLYQMPLPSSGSVVFPQILH